MIWLNPLAFTGLLLLALPIAIHLLGRGHARVQRFPTLRFLDITRLLPSRRTILQDIPLLLVRLAVVLAAIAALARPLLLTSERRAQRDATLVRAIIVDTSASMTGQDTAVARQLTTLQSEADLALVLRTATPATAVAGAVHWLQQHSGRADIVVISDFQVGSIDSATWLAVPAEVGIRLLPIPRGTLPPEQLALSRTGLVSARTTSTPLRTDIVWEPRVSGIPVGPQLLAGADSIAARQALLASRVVATPWPVDSVHAVTVVYQTAPERQTLLSGAAMPDSNWMIEQLSRVLEDTDLRRTAFTASLPAGAILPRGVVVARNGTDAIVIVATRTSRDNQSRLTYFCGCAAGDLLSAVLLHAVAASRSVAASPAEQETAVIAAKVLSAWERPAAVTGMLRAGDDHAGDASDGRWLWGAALALLVLEWLMRRRPRPDARANAQPV